MNEAFSTNFTIQSKSKREKEVYEEYYTRVEKYIPRKAEKPCNYVKLLQINEKKKRFAKKTRSASKAEDQLKASRLSWIFASSYQIAD